MTHVLRLREEAICRRICKAREAAALTREGLARSLTAFTGTTVSSRDVGRFESSQVPWELLSAIAHQTGTSKAWLLGGDARAGTEGEAPRPMQSSAPTIARPEPSARRRARLPGGIALLAMSAGFVLALAVERATGSLPAAALVMVVVVGVAVGRHMR